MAAVGEEKRTHIQCYGVRSHLFHKLLLFTLVFTAVPNFTL